MAAHVKVINTGGGTCIIGEKGHRALLKGAGRTQKGAGRRALPFRASWSTAHHGELERGCIYFTSIIVKVLAGLSLASED